MNEPRPRPRKPSIAPTGVVVDHALAQHGNRVSVLLADANGRERVVSLRAGESIVIGRASRRSGSGPPERVGPAGERVIALEDATLSRHHARISDAQDGLWAQDLGSTNGTWLGGERIERARLGDGSALRLGESTLSLRVLETSDPARPAPSGRDPFLSPHAGTASRDPAMQRLMQEVTRAARSALAVLIEGETGRGSELLARTLHAQSTRYAGPFVPVDCRALAPSLVAGTLFGNEKGAFAGAGQRHPGVFEAAHGGSVLLDEIGALPPAAQAGVLRVLEYGRVRREGAVAEIAVDVRVFATTQRDLEAMCERGSFRPDLWFRLNVLTLRVPPPPPAGGGRGPGAGGLMQRYEAEVIRAALQACDWSQARAAARLRMPRRSLARKIAQHGITPPLRS